MASRSQTEQQLNQSQDLGELLNELANKIERLKTLYEQYFMGIEKIEPQVARKEVTRVMLTLQQQYIRNTALRFKFNTMLQKWNIYITYWNRVLREIENGTYVRHLAKAKRKADAEGRELPSEMPFKKVPRSSPSGVFDGGFTDIDTGAHPIPPPPKTDPELEQIFEKLTGSGKAADPLLPAPPKVPSASPKLPPPAPAAARTDGSPPPRNLPGVPPPKPRPGPPPPGPPPPPAAALLPKIPGMSEGELRALHQRYVDAQKKSGAAATVKYETLVSSLAKQVPAVLKQPGVKAVRFDVAVQDGKPVLKAIPQK